MLKYTTGNSFFSFLRNQQTVVRILSIILFVVVVAFVLFQGSKSIVTISINGVEADKVSTHAQTVGELLEEQKIQVTEYDKLSPAKDTEIKSGMEIDWKQAEEVILSIDGKKSSIWTTENIVKNVLAEAKIHISEYDVVSKSLDADLADDRTIDVQRGFQLKLVDGGKTTEVWSTSTTVANFLKNHGIQLGKLDRVEKNLDAMVKANDRIEVVRVEKVTDVVEVATDFAVEKKKDTSLLKGKEKVITKGAKGKVERTYELVKENGKVVTKSLKSEKVIQKPTTKVVAVGTKVVVASVSRSNNVEAVPADGKEFYVTATAYTPYCSGCSGISAAGINLRANPNLKLIAVDPRVIPLGTKVWVEGYGYAVAGDTGGAIKGNKIDLLMQTKQQAYSWGRKTVRIKVLN